METKTLSVLTVDDLAFLTNLANELKTQDRAYTAKPVIYQIMEAKKEVCIDLAYADGPALALGDDATAFYDEDVEGARAWLLDGFDWTAETLDDIRNATSLRELADFCEEHDINYHYTGFRDIETFTGFFLTKAALQRHVEANAYHYTNPVSYAQYAGFRNPELERLLTIIEKFATVAEMTH